MDRLPFTFLDEAGAVRVDRPDLPAPWIHYLGNGRLHAMVSQAAGGFAWYRSPVLKRLTRYRQQHLPIDSPGFYVWIREADGSVWSPSWRPACAPVEDFAAEFRPGFAAYRARRGGREARLTLWVAPDDVLVWEVEVADVGGGPAEVDVFAAVEMSQPNWESEAGWGYYLRHQHEAGWDEALGGPRYFAHPTHDLVTELPIVGFAADRRPDSWDADRDAFVGNYRSEALPAAVEAGRCGDRALTAGEACLAQHHRLGVPAGGTAFLNLFLIASPDAALRWEEARGRMLDLAEAYRDPVRRAAARAETAAWWADRLGRYEARTPDADVDRMANRWGPLQVAQVGRYSRSVNAWAPGIRGVGFRDTAQDAVALATLDAPWAWENLRLLLRHQFADGHAVHYLYPEERRAPATSVHCDNHLWLAFAAYAVAAETGPGGWLDEPIPFLAADARGADGEGDLAEHLLRALRWTGANLGAHGLPLIFRSDWNDIIGKFSRDGRGESVMAAMQAAVAADRTADLLAWMGRDPAEARAFAARMRAAVEACAWDGAWWIRAFDDDGDPVGARDSRFGKLWLNAQTWAVLAGVGTVGQRRAGMDAAWERLATPMGFRKLWPGFATYPEVADPFSGYSPGCGENGAIFCHAHAWAVIAEAELGRADRAWEAWRAILPSAAMARVGLDRYQAEPYAYVSNFVGPENARFGWANVNQVTGTAAWMHIALTQHLLGVRPTLDGLELRPCLPPGWGEGTVERTFRGARHRFTLVSPPA